MESESREAFKIPRSSWSLREGRYLGHDGFCPVDERLEIVSIVRVVAGVCLTAWGAFMTLVFGPMSLTQGNGSSLVMGFGLLAAGLLTAVPRNHRLSGVAALVSLAVGVLLIVAGYKLWLDYSGNGVPGDAEPWPYRLAGATLLALGGLAIGRLPSRPAHRGGSGRAA